MKLLFDQNISHRIVHLLEDLIPHAKQVRSLGLENLFGKTFQIDIINEQHLLIHRF